MSDLLTLAQKCENAEGPDRRIDALIWLLQPCEAPDCNRELRDDIVKRFLAGQQWGDSEVPSYTASVDDAASLVPEGLEWIVSNQRMKRLPDSTPKQFDGWAGVYGGPMVGSECDSFAANPALALCAAALQAEHYRASVSTPGGPDAPA